MLFDDLNKPAPDGSRIGFTARLVFCKSVQDEYLLNFSDRFWTRYSVDLVTRLKSCNVSLDISDVDDCVVADVTAFSSSTSVAQIVRRIVSDLVGYWAFTVVEHKIADDAASCWKFVLGALKKSNGGSVLHQREKLQSLKSKLLSINSRIARIDQAILETNSSIQGISTGMQTVEDFAAQLKAQRVSLEQLKRTIEVRFRTAEALIKINSHLIGWGDYDSDTDDGPGNATDDGQDNTKKPFDYSSFDALLNRDFSIIAEAIDHESQSTNRIPLFGGRMLKDCDPYQFTVFRYTGEVRMARRASFSSHPDLGRLRPFLGDGKHPKRQKDVSKILTASGVISIYHAVSDDNEPNDVTRIVAASGGDWFAIMFDPDSAEDRSRVEVRATEYILARLYYDDMTDVCFRHGSSEKQVRDYWSLVSAPSDLAEKMAEKIFSARGGFRFEGNNFLF